MREIKFRVWDKTNKKFIHSPGRIFIDVFDGTFLDGKIDDFRDDLELLQFTGLLDKNGKEIYEGDILDCDQLQGLKFRVKGVAHFGVETRYGQQDSRVYIDTRPFDKNIGNEFCIIHNNPEIIGNIFENPELLN